MKLTSAIILLVIVGAVGYIFWFQPPWFWDLFNKGTQAAQGYLPAKTPNEAADYFAKAINDRNYKSASEYCTGDYGEALKKAHDAARDLGKQIDTINNLANDKGVNTDKAQLMLRYLDPFPLTLKVKEVSEVKDGKATAQIQLDMLSLDAAPDSSFDSLDPVMFRMVLMPPNPGILTVNLVEEGEGDQKQWKLDIPLTPVMRQNIDHYIKNHKSYITALDGIAVHLRASGGITNKKEFESELSEDLAGAK
jgi:hypothetical protein